MAKRKGTYMVAGAVEGGHPDAFVLAASRPFLRSKRLGSRRVLYRAMVFSVAIASKVALRRCCFILQDIHVEVPTAENVNYFVENWMEKGFEQGFDPLWVTLGIGISAPWRW